MGKTGALAIIGALSVIALAACAPSASPEQLRTQATVLAAQSSGAAREARSLESQATAAAIERAAMLATSAALLVTPSATPAPTLTPLPTVTLTPEPTLTPAPSATPAREIVIVVTQAPSATPSAPAAPRERNIYDDWPIVVALALAALAAVIVLWRLIDGKTVILPGRGDNNGQ